MSSWMMLPIRSWSTAAPAWPNTGVAGPGCPSRAFIPDLPERWMIAGCLRLSGRLCREAPGGRERPLRGCETRRAEVWLSGSYRESGRSAEGRLLSATLVPRLTARRHQAAPLLSVLGRRIRTRADGPTLRRTLCAIDKSIQPATWLAIRVVSPELFADPFDRLQQS